MCHTMPTNPYLGQLRGCLRIWARGQSTLSQGLQGSQPWIGWGLGYG
jgi:hypothetical protein